MRSEARIFTSRSDDPEWTSLPMGPQWAYDLLLSQADLEHNGVIALRRPRWAAQATDVTVPQLDSYLAVLAEQRYIVIDERYGEVLVRTLLRGDKVYRQPNVLRSAADRLGQIMSPTIREALHVELLRIADQPDLSETCALIVKEMLEATEAGADRRTPPRRVGLDTKPPAKTPAKDSANPLVEGAGNPSRKGSGNPSENAATQAPAKAAAYRPGELAVNPPPGTHQGTIDTDAEGSGAPSPEPQSKGSRQASANPSPKGSPDPSGKPRPQATTIPAPADSAAAQAPNADVQQILAAWLHSTADHAPTPQLVAAIETILTAAHAAGEPVDRLTAAIGQWQQEDGTDPARLTTMISNASPSAPRPVAPAAADTPAEAKPLGGWQFADLEAATIAITNPWLNTLATQPTSEVLEDIEYHISAALIAGHRPEVIAATLTAWHAAGDTDTWHLSDHIEAATAALPAPQPAGARPAPPAPLPTSAEEWLSTARSKP